MVKVIWTQLSIDDLKSIYDYISKDSKSYANKFIEKIIDRVNLLETFPNSGRIVPEFNSNEIREIIEGNYRIIYKIKEGSIGILRIHHAARQLKEFK